MKKASHWLRKSVVSSAIFAGNRALGFLARGRALGYFLGGYVPPGTPNWHPVLKKISSQIDTPF